MDDDGYADADEEGRGKGRREVVNVTKAQAPFGPGSTSMRNKKRYLGEYLPLVLPPLGAENEDGHLSVNEGYKATALTKYSFQYDWSSRRHGSRDSSSHQC